MNKIVYGKDYWAGFDNINGMSGWDFWLHKKIPVSKHKAAKGARTGTPLKAYINHGRWVVDCPYCSGAEHVDPDDKSFFCFNCGMEHNGNRPQPVTFPLKATRLKIEEVLVTRPIENRNWTKETLAELQRVNIKNGLDST